MYKGYNRRDNFVASKKRLLTGEEPRAPKPHVDRPRHTPRLDVLRQQQRDFRAQQQRERRPHYFDGPHPRTVRSLFADYQDPPFDYTFGAPSPAVPPSGIRTALRMLIEGAARYHEMYLRLSTSGLANEQIEALLAYEGVSFPS